jgi:thiol-disulfide isomerase/thioredoxin
MGTLTLGVENFAGTRVLDSRSILTVFYAEWCPFCRNFLKAFEATMKGKTNPVAALVDISNGSNPLWETFAVQIVPTLVGFRSGEVIVRKDGVAEVGLGVLDVEDALRRMQFQ